MSWKDYVEKSLRGNDGEDGSYMAGVFSLNGAPLAVHPSEFVPTDVQVKRLIDVIDGKDLEQLQTNGCIFHGMKFAFLKTDVNMVCLQRKRMKEGEELLENSRWPLCAYKTKQCILIRISKLGPVSGRENTGKTGQIGDYLNANLS
ncbi:hypothetical protein KP79_PYT06627 [Mizuhopecten yessoensis]|uniref:Profilin n=1 Tax=Mizuhopecten yessoensis TaxID=6573 RepID=A0A210Q5D1_MIZYE|nr:hypothetical protein KP79_PYT06627 [Mizuhopecten yessoensis]